MHHLRQFTFATLLFAVPLIAQPPINGPMPGRTAHNEVAIWLQCQGPCSVELEYYATEDAQAPKLRTGVQTSDPRDAHAMTFDLRGLAPGTWYTYHVLVNGRRLVTPEDLLVRTAPLVPYGSDAPDFTVATGSCAYLNEAGNDRPGKPYGGDYGIFDAMADQEPDLMLWLGDNVYFRDADLSSLSGFQHRYTHARGTKDLQRLLRSTHHVAIWDDHDFGPNDADGSFINAGMARATFDLFWPNPVGRPTGLRTNTTAFSYADVDFFLLDNRTERVPPRVSTSTPAILGDGQIDWLIRALKASKASFKVVAVGGQFLNDAPVYENMATVPRERQALIERIDKEGIANVVFLSGDRHFTELSRLTYADGRELHDLTVSPLTSGAYAPNEENRLSVTGSRVTERNFATLFFHGPRTDRKMTMTVHAANGEIIWTDELRMSGGSR